MREIKLHTAIIGSGCAGFNAADCLYDLGIRDIAIFTEGVNMGTSRNTGSDKQTYYKLGLSGGPDSVTELAATLFDGGAVDGDIALCEAANSAKCFYKLVNLGVPFPCNDYGEFVGYKTDHDPRERASSAGPLTSKFMTEKLEASVKNKKIPVYDGYYIYKIIVKDGAAVGAKAVYQGEDVKITAKNLILATGGPAGVYSKSVYPESQTGSAGLAIDCGAELVNFSEWQYGLASTGFRWNVSGTYQQVLPRYVAVDKNGAEREFLPEYFDTPQKALDMVFLKGYQWPFDAAKINGSSIIDLIVHHETFTLGNRVYMDFTKDPIGLDFDLLNDTTKEYLFRSGATMPLPIKRLEHMNPKAIQIYKDHNIDLYTDRLEVAVCAQHHNGGIAVDKDWQTSIKNLYACGECAGTFGIYRPGGSALNSTQVGSLRAAESIARNTDGNCGEIRGLSGEAEKENKDLFSLVRFGKSTVDRERRFYGDQMSRSCSHVRNITEIETLLDTFIKKKTTFFDENIICDKSETADLFRNRNILLTCIALLKNALFTAKHGSRGGCIVSDKGGEPLIAGYRYKKYDFALDGKKVVQKGEDITLCPVRQIPKPDNWFENVWKDFNRKWRV